MYQIDLHQLVTPDLKIKRLTLAWQGQIALLREGAIVTNAKPWHLLGSDITADKVILGKAEAELDIAFDQEGDEYLLRIADGSKMTMIDVVLPTVTISQLIVTPDKQATLTLATDSDEFVLRSTTWIVQTPPIKIAGNRYQLAPVALDIEYRAGTNWTLHAKANSRNN